MTPGMEKQRDKIRRLRDRLYALEVEYQKIFESAETEAPEKAEAETMVATLQLARGTVTRGYFHGIERSFHIRRGT